MLARTFLALTTLLFAVFLMRGASELPFLRAEQKDLPLARQFDSADAALWQAHSTFQRATTAPSDEEAQAASARAQEYALESLSLRPLNPKAWLLAAQTAYVLERDADAVDDLMVSTTIAPFENSDVISRIDLAVRLWWELSEEEKATFVEQASFAWKRRPQDLVQLAIESPAHEILIGKLLATRPEALEAFLKRLEQSSNRQN